MEFHKIFIKLFFKTCFHFSQIFTFLSKEIYIRKFFFFFFKSCKTFLISAVKRILPPNFKKLKKSKSNFSFWVEKMFWKNFRLHSEINSHSKCLKPLKMSAKIRHHIFFKRKTFCFWEIKKFLLLLAF